MARLQGRVTKERMDARARLAVRLAGCLAGLDWATHSSRVEIPIIGRARTRHPLLYKEPCDPPIPVNPYILHPYTYLFLHNHQSPSPLNCQSPRHSHSLTDPHSAHSMSEVTVCSISPCLPVSFVCGETDRRRFNFPTENLTSNRTSPAPCCMYAELIVH